MDLRHAALAAAVPCLCLLAPDADAQLRRARARPPATFDLNQLPPPPSQRPVERPELTEAPAPLRPAGLLQAWEVGGNAVVGIGRHTVAAWPRPRTHTERMRAESLTGETHNIAGARLSVRF